MVHSRVSNENGIDDFRRGPWVCFDCWWSFFFFFFFGGGVGGGGNIYFMHPQSIKHGLLNGSYNDKTPHLPDYTTPALSTLAIKIHYQYNGIL